MLATQSQMLSNTPKRNSVFYGYVELRLIDIREARIPIVKCWAARHIIAYALLKLFYFYPIAVKDLKYKLVF